VTPELRVFLAVMAVEAVLCGIALAIRFGI
jgi:hypothetical protein